MEQGDDGVFWRSVGGALLAALQQRGVLRQEEYQAALVALQRQNVFPRGGSVSVPGETNCLGDEENSGSVKVSGGEKSCDKKSAELKIGADGEKMGG